MINTKEKISGVQGAHGDSEGAPYADAPYPMELIPEEEGGYVVRFPDLPGCLSAGGTVDEAVTNAQVAKREWLAAAIEDGADIPRPASMDEYSGQFKLRLPRSLHRDLAVHARREGVSMNQYCVYLLAKNDALTIGDAPRDASLFADADMPGGGTAAGDQASEAMAGRAVMTAAAATEAIAAR